MKRFKDGVNSLEDEPRAGRPRKDHLVPEVQSLLDENQFLSQKKLASMLNVHTDVIHRILQEDLGLTRVNFRWIPYRLNQSQKEVRVRLSKSLLETLEQSSHQMIITGDETWVYLRNPRTSMWIDSDMPRPERPKHTIGSKKVMISVFWSSSGMHIIRMLPPGEKFIKSYFIDEVMVPLMEALSQKKGMKKKKRIFFHFDDASPHSIDRTLSEMGYNRLPHPPYSPDLAPSDFFLFGYLKNLIEGKEFETPDQLFQEVSKILRSISKGILSDAYDEWMDRLNRCIELDGEYVH